MNLPKYAITSHKLKKESKTMNSRLKIKILRDVKIITYPFTDYFLGFEKVDAVEEIFGEKTEEVLRNLKVEFRGGRGYMAVSNIDGHLIVSANYLKNGDIVELYLDVIHELVHVRQFMEGKELFDWNYNYIDRPTEIEAFQHAVKEARKLGLTDERICSYLKTERMSDEELKRLATALQVDYEAFLS
jgi:hypothetical protein